MALAGHHTAALRQRPWVRIPLNYRTFFAVDLQLLKLNCNYDCDDHISATDPDLQIRVGGGGGGGGGLQKKFFGPFGLHFGLKIRGGPGSPGPLP